MLYLRFWRLLDLCAFRVQGLGFELVGLALAFGAI